jgi:hypothetical protein
MRPTTHSEKPFGGIEVSGKLTASQMNTKELMMIVPVSRKGQLVIAQP